MAIFLANDAGTDLGLVSVGGVTVAANGETVIAGQAGVLRISQDGTYTYVLNPDSAVLASLSEGEEFEESFDYVAGNAVGEDQGVLKIMVTGAADPEPEPRARAGART